jgi:hypothetical protein
VVLLMLDFPEHKRQTAALKAQNERLADEYRVVGYPTVIFLRPDGRKVGKELNYRGGGSGRWIAMADAILRGRPRKG